MANDFQQPLGRIQLDDPLVDGRQSETALKVWRGTARLLRQFDFACLPEVSGWPNGFDREIVAVHRRLTPTPRKITAFIAYLTARSFED